MSSILKALKKLEDRSRGDAGKAISGPGARAVAKAGRRRYFKAAAFVFIALLSLAGGLIFLRRPSHVGRTSSPAVSQQGLEVKRQAPQRTSAGERLAYTKSSPISSEHPTTRPRRSLPPRRQAQPSPKRSEARRVLPLTAAPSRTPEASAGGRVEKGPVELALQAIAWSKDPQDRLAVINGQLVREGGTIDGCAVSQIDADEVTVQNGTKSWKLKFTRR